MLTTLLRGHCTPSRCEVYCAWRHQEKLVYASEVQSTLLSAQAHQPSIRLSSCGYVPNFTIFVGSVNLRSAKGIATPLRGMRIAGTIVKAGMQSYQGVCALQIPSRSLRPRRARLIRGPSGPTAAVIATEKPPPAATAERNGSGRRVMIIGGRWEAPHIRRGWCLCARGHQLMHENCHSIEPWQMHRWV